MKIFKKILGVVCLIMAITCVGLLISRREWVFVVETVMWSFLAFLLFRKKRITKTEPHELSEPVIKTDGYVETDTMIYRADGQKISESEIPYLMQVGYEQALKQSNILSDLNEQE